jgi:hypothetical protein
MKNFEKNIFEIWIEFFCFWILKKMAIGNGKIEKNDFQIWIEICHENLKLKIEIIIF